MSSNSIADVAAAVGLHEGRHGVEEVLRHLCARERAGNRTLSRLTGLPVPVVAAVCAELRFAGLELTQRLGWSQAANCACRVCGGIGITLPAPLDALRPDLQVALRDAPP